LLSLMAANPRIRSDPGWIILGCCAGAQGEYTGARAATPRKRSKAPSVNDNQGFGFPAKFAAAKIIRAVERDRRQVLIGVDAHVLAFLKQLFPVGLQRSFSLGFRRSQSAEVQGEGDTAN